MIPVPKLWPGSTIVCIGGGPSLTQADVDYCRGRARVIAINDAYRLAPWADVLYAADAKWWQVHKGVMNFAGIKYGITPTPKNLWNVHILRNDGPRGLCLDPRGLRVGSNSGYQAINLAVHLGASRIVLLGYDMCKDGKGRSHWFGEHPAPLSRNSSYQGFLGQFPSLVEPLKALGVEVINCTRRTVLKTFPERPLEDVLTAERYRRVARVPVSWPFLLEALHLPSDTKVDDVRLRRGAVAGVDELELVVEHPELAEQELGNIGDASPTFERDEAGVVTFLGWGQGVTPSTERMC